MEEREWAGQMPDLLVEKQKVKFHYNTEDQF